MSIKGQITDNINYDGNIKVTINNKGRKSELKLHNSGTKLLFDTVTKALAGYSIKNETPQYIDIKYTRNNESINDDTNPLISALSSPVVLTGKVYGEPAGASSDVNYGRVQFEAELDHSVKIDNITGFNWRLELLSRSKQKLADIVDTNETHQVLYIYNAINNTNEVIIEWALQFSNPS